MTWNEFRKLIHQKGWVLVRHGSSHDVYRKPGRNAPLLVERHWKDEIRPNLQKALLKQIED
ncbi:MAG: type II toxin-antitoxin system HicA family toxin [Bacteroidales bacterium]|nr:type II toxin-antitoxin system HicA family toxin [Bacteroidales bacterium]